MGLWPKQSSVAIDQQSDLSGLELKVLQKFSKLIDKDVFNCLTLKGSIEFEKAYRWYRF